MAPKTRSSKLNAAVEAIDISEFDPEVDRKSKKQKTAAVAPNSSKMLNRSASRDENGMDIDVDTVHSIQGDASAQQSPQINVQEVVKNKPLKGRKRFKADLADMENKCKKGFVYADLRLQQCQAGEDEGSIDLTVEDTSNVPNIFHLNIYISDTSDYPSSHSVFAAAATDDIPASVQEAVGSVSSYSPQPIQDMLFELFASISNSLKGEEHVTLHEEESDGEESADNLEEFYYDDMPTATPNGQSNISLAHLQREFVEIAATGYRPGLTRFTGGDYCISISLPIVKLAQMIPPRALMAWDRRLLSRQQHLTLLISGFRGVYPPLMVDGLYSAAASKLGVSVTFKVGLTRKYKAGKEQAQEAFTSYGLIGQDTPGLEHNGDEEYEDEGRFDSFSLSSSLETLLNTNFLKIVQYRRKFGLGWAAAELLYSLVEQNQASPEDVFRSNHDTILAEDGGEAELGRTNDLPHDPLYSLDSLSEINLPLTSFCYLIRRLLFISRYCVVCHNKTNAQFEALKPYVCDSKLCSYRYYAYNQGPSLEYEIIHNTEMVDLLISLAYCAAVEGVLDDPLPIGMGLRVPLPFRTEYQHSLPTVPATIPNELLSGADGLYDFDQLDKAQMRQVIVRLIDSLPSVCDMKKHLLQKVKAGQSKPKLKDLDNAVLPAAWSVLRWCVASCTAHLEELKGDNLIGNVDRTWRQFRFSVGAPDAEAKFKTAIQEAQQRSSRTREYPTLYAFHGSPLKNWHSIIRHGLWYKQVAHGRVYGDGVYMAKEGSVSMGYYAMASRSRRRNSGIFPTNCVALTEVVNAPHEFVSWNPYYVVKDTSWIMCRYLLVKTSKQWNDDSSPQSDIQPVLAASESIVHITPTVRLDPQTPVTLNQQQIVIPEPAFQLERLLTARREEYIEEDNDDEDALVFNHDSNIPSQSQLLQAASDWDPNCEYVRQAIANLLPPPLEASSSATAAVQRELREMLKEQNAAKKKPGGLKELGWFLPDLSEDGDDDKGGGIMDNLFQWIVELHSFEGSLPIAQDMKTRGINSLIFEIRFPPSFPHSPPFFRIITPRFLSFRQGGGGHVTLGGSMCMDLLTADGWLPSYSIAAVLLQIKLAISNTEPYPARLSTDWDRPYGIMEALEGFKRAANFHGWKVPPGLDRLAR